MSEDEKQLPKPTVQDHGPRCPACAAFPKLLHTVLDPRHGKTIHLYQCDCGERMWNDETP
jgi:hypothetical protein